MTAPDTAPGWARSNSGAAGDRPRNKLTTWVQSPPRRQNEKQATTHMRGYSRREDTYSIGLRSIQKAGLEVGMQTDTSIFEHSPSRN